MNTKTRLAVFVSGSGSNLQAIIDAKVPTVEIALVFSNNPNAYAIERIKKYGISSLVIDHGGYSSREDYEKEILRSIESYNIDLIALAGFMRILSPYFVSRFKNRIMNLHPALLPAFAGINSVKRALEYGVKYTGCTVHFVDEGVDTGPIILQSVVPIFENDTEDSLLERIHEEEHRIYPEAIRLFSEGKLKIRGRRVSIESQNS
jgi:phosphoribosylglycinamide formyltransferase-1